MPQTRETASLRSALQYVMSSDMPSEHKLVLIELLTQALRDQDAHVEPQSLHADRPWEEADASVLRSLLTGKTATSWQHADELLTRAATALGRDPQYVRRKAADLGYGESVDFRVAKARASERARQ